MNDDHETLPTAAGRRARSEPDLEERYVDLGPLGAGAFGEVRRVRDKRLNRIVAMKVLRREHASDPLDVARFVDEAQAAAQLQHPGIVPIYDTGLLPDGRPWFTMREFAGRNLHVAIRDTYRRIDRSDPLPDLHVLIDALRRAAEAIGYAHRRGVIHRDLKPSNVLLDDDGAVLVVDWGLAKVVQPGHVELTGRDALLRTMTGTLLGTPAYMPPEQAEGRIRALDARTDVYALGAMLYSILAGKAPYQGTSGLGAVVAVLEGPPTPVREAARFPLPAVLVAICERAMQRERDDRHPQASALAEDLAGWLQGRVR